MKSSAWLNSVAETKHLSNWCHLDGLNFFLVVGIESHKELNTGNIVLIISASREGVETHIIGEGSSGELILVSHEIA